MKKKILGLTVAVIIIVTIYGLVKINQAPHNIRNVDPEIKLPAITLYGDFNEDESQANKKYLDKVVEIEGTIQDITIDIAGNVNIYLDAGLDAIGTVSCSFEPKSNAMAKNQKQGNVIKVKGVCTGFLMDVVLNKCVIIN